MDIVIPVFAKRVGSRQSTENETLYLLCHIPTYIAWLFVNIYICIHTIHTYFI